MRDLDALLTSLVNIDRESLIAILLSEAEAAARLAKSIRQRTASQRLKRREAIERAARIDRIVFSCGTANPDRICPTLISLFANLLRISCELAADSKRSAAGVE